MSDDGKIARIADRLRSGDQSDDLPPADPPPFPGEDDPSAAPETGTNGSDGKPRWSQFRFDDAGAPLTPLGRGDAEWYFLDAGGALRTLTASKFDDKHIESLVTPRTAWLTEAYPHLNKDGDVVGWSGKKARVSLLNAASRKGPFDPSERLRGKGAWIEDGGGLVYHAGDVVWRDGKRRKTGLIDGYLYPKRAAGLAPGKAEDAFDAAGRVLELIESWNFEKGDDAARLVFGHLCVQLICGALEFRPSLYLTGNEGSGKTTLLKLMAAVNGGGLVMASDATPAGIYQSVRDNALPVALDEAEPDIPMQRQKQLLSVMRASASGGFILRGSGEHKSISFTSRSAFVFGSITPLQMSRADLSRTAMIEIDTARGKLPPYTVDELREAGAAILARFIRHWSVFQDRLSIWRDALFEAGHDPRGVDAYGTLLAAACFARFDRPPGAEEVKADAARFAVAAVDEDGVESQGEMCLQAILQHSVQMDGDTKRRQIFAMVAALANRPLHEDPNGYAKLDPWRAKYDTTLRQHGLAVLAQFFDNDGNLSPPTEINRVPLEKRETILLAIANKHQGLARIFNDAREDTPWRTQAGSAHSGWSPTIKRLKAAPWYARASPAPMRFMGKLTRATMVQIGHLTEDSGA